jgi:hypothetical protein
MTKEGFRAHIIWISERLNLESVAIDIRISTQMKQCKKFKSFMASITS